MPTLRNDASGRPRRYRVTNVTRGSLLADRANLAANPLTRGLGLMGRPSLMEGEGLIIRPCNSVVSFFMRFPIDVLFVDKDQAVRHIVKRMVPWRTSRIVRGSKLVIELPAGTCLKTDTVLGDRLVIEPSERSD